ncbi:kinase-like domain-containing protein [Pisolithus orientalis]|uniref:kinase-like domain-containing protein n=1 Tax=Pisolithus orientalis TaxID=936130 RepID=UPI0022243C83|nr:kinase-like domain-containing protein [Pisolithus orientalis]KAI6008344.1 kinase-like domain-containing protein [Pisolithus orientalis]
MSTNGVVINGYKIRKTSAIVMHGDTIKIPASLTFQCVQKWRCLPDRRTTLLVPSPHSIKNMGRYLITPHCLGTGSYATVHLAIDTSAHRQAACKIIRRKEGSDLKKDMKEATMLMALHHPNINRVYAVESDSEFLYIMLQLSTGGDLFTYITTHVRHRLCEGESKYITYQLLKALKYLHDRMISHRDLKPENILLHTPGPYPRIQIADFGLARPKAFQETLHVCGTISYLPPEAVRALDCPDLGYVGMPADCWSTGVVIFAMLSWVLSFRPSALVPLYPVLTCVLSRGSHPFDFEGSLYGTEDSSFSEEVGSDGLGTGWSQGSHIRDERTKQRILEGNITFCEVIWDPLKDGGYTLVPAMHYVLLYLANL